MEKAILLRRKVGFFILTCGVIAGLSAFLFVSSNIGLCRYDSICEKQYENMGKFIFVPTFFTFVLGALAFVHTKGGRILWAVSLAVLLFSVDIIFFMEEGSGGGWGFPNISNQAIFGSLLVVMYGTYILSAFLKEVLGEKFSLMKRISGKRMFFLTFVIIILTWITIGEWL